MFNTVVTAGASSACNYVSSQLHVCVFSLLFKGKHKENTIGMTELPADAANSDHLGHRQSTVSLETANFIEK